jgi:hypothetical protein
MNPELLGALSEETLNALKMLDSGPGDGTIAGLRKTTTQATGLVNYDLRPLAVLLTPIITPLRNMIPRVGGGGDTATRWKAITSFNANGTSPVVAEGQRGASADITVVNYTAAYKGLGIESDVTFEATYADKGFDDARARSVESALRALMVAEERFILDGNTSLQLASTTTPAVAAIASGVGSLAAGTYIVYCVPLTPHAYRKYTVASGLPGQITRANNDGSTVSFNGGNGQVSTVSAGLVIAGTNSIGASVTPVKGAAAYAWYTGLTGGGAAAASLQAITTVANVQIDAIVAQTVPQYANDAKIAADYSTNALAFDGIMTQALTTGAGYYKALPANQGLTSDGKGGVVEIEAALRWFWDNQRTGPTRMLVNAQEYYNLYQKAITGNTIMRTPGTGSIRVTAGGMIDGYFNKYAMGTTNLVNIMLHPDVVPGTIIFVTDQLPSTYPTPNIPGVMQIKTRQEYYQIEWPLRTRKYEYGVYCDEVLQVFAPFTLGVLTNIANL